jgi:hypothetical protein
MVSSVLHKSVTPLRVFVFICIAVILQSGAGTPVFADDAANTAGAGQALLILKSKNLDDMHATITALEDEGIEVAHVIPPRVVIARLPNGAEQFALAISNVASVHKTAIAPFALAEGADIVSGVAVWNHLLASRAAGPRKIPQQAMPLVGDAFEPPLSPELFAPQGVSMLAPSALPGNNSTSEFMVGKIAVGVILPESNETSQNTEDWDSARQTTVFNKIVEGLDWWVTKSGSSANLTFYYDQRFSVPTQYEPITMNGTGDEYLWVSDIFQNMGYTSGNQFDRARAYINNLRTTLGTDWCLAVIVVDSLNDEDGIFANGMYFAWANLGGPYFVMNYVNDGYGIGNMHLVARHETGHIFLAGDEYCQPGYACCGFGNYGYLNVYNGNCENNNPNSVDCIMKYNSDAVCQYTNGQIGWRDTDGDGRPDTIDNVVSNSINPYPTPTTQTALTFTGNAVDIPCYSPTRTDVTINRVSVVKYEIDGGPWIEADAVDGAFDEDVEDYTFTTPPLGAGVHRISTRAWSTSGNGSAVSYQDVEVQIPGNGKASWPSPSEYARHISLTPTLTWRPGTWAQETGGQAVYFGLDFNDVNDATPGNPKGVYKGRQDVNSYTPASPLYLGANYYWRIDEYNDTNSDSPWTGQVWQFTTGGGEATEPKPASGTVGLSIPLQLSWRAGAWAAQHDVYFSTSQVDLLDATVAEPLGAYKGRQSSTVYELSSLDYNLVADTNYYWRIDEVNDTNVWTGEVWIFGNTNYFIIDDFESYADNNEMLQRWNTDSIDPCCSLTGGGASIVLNSGAMEFKYDNNGTDDGNDYFSEARFDANGADWAGGSVLPINDRIRGLAISYIGGPGNDADPDYDRMYVAIEDMAGNFGMLLNDNPEAQRTSSLEQWNINFADLNSPPLNPAAVRYLYIGFGVRCNRDVQVGGAGTVRFDDVRLYKRHCVPEYSGLTADLTADCAVNRADVKFMSEQWLSDNAEADIYVDGVVNFRDFALLAQEWLMGPVLWP